MSIQWAVDIEIAGVTYRYATSALTVAGYDYQIGLNDIGEQSRITNLAEQISLKISSSYDWAAEFAAVGWSIDGGPVTLWLVIEDAGVWTRHRWITGVVDGTSWGEAGEDMEMRIVASAQRMQIPTPRAKIDPYTQPDNDPGLPSTTNPYEIFTETQGVYYPVIIGYPGWNSETGLYVPCVPIPIIQAAWLTGTVEGQSLDYIQTEILCVGTGDIEATRCVAVDVGLSLNHATHSYLHVDVQTYYDLYTATDLIGQKYKWYSVNVGTDYTGESKIYAAFEPGHGGIQYNGKVVRGASDLFEWILSHLPDVVLDVGRHRAAARFLNQYRFDTFINASTDALEWFLGQILPNVPASIVKSDDGVYLQYIPNYALPHHSVYWLENGRNAQRADMVISTARDDLANEITYQWAKGVSGYYQNTKILTSETNKLQALPGGSSFPDARAIGYTLCKHSQAKYGPRPENIELIHVYDSETAHAIARNYADLHALPVRRIDYTLTTDFYEIVPGEIVNLTDSSLSISDQLSVIEDVKLTQTEITVTLRLLHKLGSGI